MAHFPQWAATLPWPLQNLTALQGGDVAQAYCATLSPTENNLPRRIFLKTHTQAPGDYFVAEAKALQWLAQHQDLRIPKVWAVQTEATNSPWLALQWIEPGSQARDDADFGRALAACHQRPWSVFGRPDTAATGSQNLPNTPHQHWASFFSECRLQPLSRIASRHGSLSKSSLQGIEALCTQLDQLFPNDISPSLVHGDLWAGNRIVDKQGLSWLIDPAAHGNYREYDLALMQLFGGFSQTCFDAYLEAAPVAPGLNQRLELLQLPSLLSHAIRFGSSYTQQVERIVQPYSPRHQ